MISIRCIVISNPAARGTIEGASRHLEVIRTVTMRKALATDKRTKITKALIAHELHEYSRILIFCREAAQQKFLAPPFYKKVGGFSVLQEFF